MTIECIRFDKPSVTLVEAYEALDSRAQSLLCEAPNTYNLSFFDPSTPTVSLRAFYEKDTNNTIAELTINSAAHRKIGVQIVTLTPRGDEMALFTGGNLLVNRRNSIVLFATDVDIRRLSMNIRGAVVYTPDSRSNG